MGKYTTTQLLGHGVFSTVYLGVDGEGNRVALKYYTNKESQEIKQKFMLEATSLTQIDHENILRVFGFGEDEKGLYLAMEYCEYGSLKGRLDLKGALDSERTLVVCLSVLQALSVLHHAGKLHLDIRPENLFYSNDGFLKLADLGTLFDKVPLVDLPANALYYASPELLNKGTLDVRSDIYSLGATLFHILAGRAAYESDSTLDVINSHLLGEVPSLMNVLEGCPQSLDAVLQKMLAKKAEDRYQTLEEVEADIQTILSGATETAALPSFINIEEGVTVGAPTVLQPVDATVQSSFSEVQTLLENDGISISSTKDIDVSVLAEEKCDDEPHVNETPTRAAQLDLANVKLSWHMKLLVACAWLVGPVILGVYVYKTYFSVDEESTDKVVVETPKVKEKLIISLDDFVTEEKAPTKRVVAETKQIDQNVNLSFVSFAEKALPIVLQSIDRDNYFCSFKIQEGASWKSEILTLGQKSKGIRLIHIDTEHVIVEFSGMAYKIAVNQSYNSHFQLIVKNNSRELSFSKLNETRNGFTLSKINDNSIIVTGVP